MRLTDGKIMEINWTCVCEREGTHLMGEKEQTGKKKKINQQTTNKPKNTQSTRVKRGSIKDMHSS